MQQKKHLVKRLLNLSEQWKDEVLEPLGFSDFPHEALPQSHSFKAESERIAQRYATKIASTFGESEQDRDGMSEAEVIFIHLQDFFNVYNRHCQDCGWLRESYELMGLDHSYYEVRRRFIIRAVRVLQKNRP